MAYTIVPPISGLPLILCQLVVSIMCSSLIKSDRNSYIFSVYVSAKVHFSKMDFEELT